MQTILLVEDDATTALIDRKQLETAGYAVRHAFTGEEAIAAAADAETKIDLILMDIDLGDGMDGVAAAREIIGRHDLPILFLSSYTEEEVVQRTEHIQHYGYIPKNAGPAILKAMVGMSLRVFDAHHHTRELNENLIKTQEAVISSMAILAEHRDNETGGHIQRTRNYVAQLIDILGDSIPWTPYQRELIIHSAPLHDIGKVAIPDSILLKPGKLTDEEFSEMKNHTIYGYDVIKSTIDKIGENTFLEYGLKITRSHHEKWNGNGYPDGLSGRAIPLSSRLMAIADVYDALIMVRPYKKAMTHEDAVRIIEKDVGTHFDPMLGGLFLENHLLFKGIADRTKD